MRAGWFTSRCVSSGLVSLDLCSSGAAWTDRRGSRAGSGHHKPNSSKEIKTGHRGLQKSRRGSRVSSRNEAPQIPLRSLHLVVWLQTRTTSCVVYTCCSSHFTSWQLSIVNVKNVKHHGKILKTYTCIVAGKHTKGKKLQLRKWPG